MSGGKITKFYTRANTTHDKTWLLFSKVPTTNKTITHTPIIQVYLNLCYEMCFHIIPNFFSLQFWAFFVWLCFVAKPEQVGVLHEDPYSKPGDQLVATSPSSQSQNSKILPFSSQNWVGYNIQRLFWEENWHDVIDHSIVSVDTIAMTDFDKKQLIFNS